MKTSFFGIFVSLSLFPSILPAADASTVHHFRVTVQNLTAGNALSPFLSIVHQKGSSIIVAGTPASDGIAQIAETGMTTFLEQELGANALVISSKKAEGAPIMPKEKRSVEFEIDEAQLQEGSVLSIVAMMGKSNDTFVAFESLELGALKAGQTVKAVARNYDAGSEENTGNVEDFGPGGHPTAAAEGHISFDRGLNLRGNAPQIIAWGERAAFLELTKLD